MLFERLKKVLLHTVSMNQFALVADRQIIDASLIANEMINYYSRSKKKGVVIKLDIEKAFDTVDWKFLDNILAAKGFGNTWRRWMKGCMKVRGAKFEPLVV